MNHLVKVILTSCLILFGVVEALDIRVAAPDGTCVLMDVEAGESLADLQSSIQEQLFFPIDQQEILVINDTEFAANAMERRAAPLGRDYYAPVTASEKKDIAYVVNSLANRSYAYLMSHKSSLEKTEGKIEHIHPLRFLSCILTDSTMRENVYTIYKNGGWIWSKFIGNLTDNLSKESKRNNLRDEHVLDFAKTVRVDSSIMFPYIRKKEWSDFAVKVIKKAQK